MLKTWKGIVVMFGPDGYASQADPPIASDDIRETLAADLTESKIGKYLKIARFLIRRDPLMSDSWF